MSTFFEIFQPFGGGPEMIVIKRPFELGDFEFSDVYIGGAVEASETFTKTARHPKRYVEGGRRVVFTDEAWQALLDDLSQLWDDGTDFTGKHYKRRWKHNSRAFGRRTIPGFDDTFVETISLYGPSKRVDLVAKSPKAETRQLEIDAQRERVRQYVELPETLDQWLADYNEQWAGYAKWTRDETVSYTAELVKEMRVKSDWLEENMTAEDNDRIDGMHSEIDEIDEQIKVLRHRKQALRERIYTKERRVLETHLTNTQDPVLKAVFDEAIASVADEKPSMRSIFD